MDPSGSDPTEKKRIQRIYSRKLDPSGGSVLDPTPPKKNGSNGFTVRKLDPSGVRRIHLQKWIRLDPVPINKIGSNGFTVERLDPSETSVLDPKDPLKKMDLSGSGLTEKKTDATDLQ